MTAACATPSSRATDSVRPSACAQWWGCSSHGHRWGPASAGVRRRHPQRCRNCPWSPADVCRLLGTQSACPFSDAAQPAAPVFGTPPLGPHFFPENACLICLSTRRPFEPGPLSRLGVLDGGPAFRLAGERCRVLTPPKDPRVGQGRPRGGLSLTWHAAVPRLHPSGRHHR